MEKVIKIDNLNNNIKGELKNNSKGYMIKPCLAFIQVGENPLTEIIVNKLDNACNELSIYFKPIKYSVNASEKEIINKIIELNNDEYVNGIMVQLPLPSNLNAQRILNHITSVKDILGLNDINCGKLFNLKESYVSCMASSIIEALKQNNIELQGKHVVIVGKGKLIGKPLAMLFLKEDATVSICHSKTLNLKEITKQADILVSATGTVGLITSDYIKDGSIVIDAGMNYVGDKVIGDIMIEEVEKKASSILSMSLGLYDLVVSMIIKNTVISYEKNKNKVIK